MYIHLQLFINVYIYVYIYAHIDIYIYTYLSIYLYVYLSIYKCKSICLQIYIVMTLSDSSASRSCQCEEVYQEEQPHLFSIEAPP